MLRPELLRAVIDCGFEHPSEVQHECIPQAMLGMDIICQAKSGMGKTAVFVLATLQQLQPVDGEVSVLVMCHTRELAFQISKEYERFSKYLPSTKVSMQRWGFYMAGVLRLVGQITTSVCWNSGSCRWGQIVQWTSLTIILSSLTAVALFRALRQWRCAANSNLQTLGWRVLRRSAHQ